MGEITTALCEVIAFFLQGYCLQYFLSSFLAEKMTGRSKTAVVVLFFYGVFKTALGYLLQGRMDSMMGFYRLILQSIFLTILTFCFYRAAKVITVFLLTAFMALNEICFFIGYMTMSLSVPILEFETTLFTDGYIREECFEQLLLFTAASLQIMCLVVWVSLLYLSLKKIVTAFRERDYIMQRTELIFILTPAMAGLFLCILLRIIMVTVEDGMPALLYDTYPALRLLIPAILLLSLLSILYSVKLFQDMVSLNREKSGRIILEQQIETLQKHIGEIERLYTGVRSIKHDMKNTLTVLMRLFSEKETEKTPELTAYLSELNQSFDRLDFRFRTGNVVADALLNMKYHEITERIPELSFQADNLLFPEDLTVQSYDIGVILGNGLDNALEGCIRLKQKELKSVPFIRLVSFRRGKYFFLEIENSFDGRLLRDHRSEFPTTLKNDRQAHGIGFENMKKTAEKYGGTVDYSVAGYPDQTENAPGYAIFTLSVMLRA